MGMEMPESRRLLILELCGAAVALFVLIRHRRLILAFLVVVGDRALLPLQLHSFSTRRFVGRMPSVRVTAPTVDKLRNIALKAQSRPKEVEGIWQIVFLILVLQILEKGFNGWTPRRLSSRLVNLMCGPAEHLFMS